VQDSLFAKKLSPKNDVDAAHDQATETKQRLDIVRKQLEDIQASGASADRASRGQIESLRRILAEQQRRVKAMRVTSPEAGQLQSLGNPPLELGQYVNAGSLLARVVQPGKLKAVLRVPENQAKDVVPNLPRDDRSAQQHDREGPRDAHRSVVGSGYGHGGSRDRRSLPRARAPISRSTAPSKSSAAQRAVHRRPGFGQAESSVGIFKVTKARAKRAASPFHSAAPREHDRGQKGLSVGDSVIISDMSQFDNYQQSRIK
jgi:hypothetical protein